MGTRTDVKAWPILVDGVFRAARSGETIDVIEPRHRRARRDRSAGRAPTTSTTPLRPLAAPSKPGG